MPGLAKSEITLRDYPAGTNVLTLDIDPTVYSPFQVPIRGSMTKVLDGTVVRQFMGLNTRDYTLELQGVITERDTVQELWTRYRNGGAGVQYELRDWYGSAFVVVFTPGIVSFQPQPITGACNAHTFSLNFSVCQILLLFGNAY